MDFLYKNSLCCLATIHEKDLVMLSVYVPQLLLLVLLTEVKCTNEMKCPTWKWFNYSSAKCECGSSVRNTIRCSDDGSVFARFDVCVSWDNESNNLITGTCKFKTSQSYWQRIYSELPSDPQNLTSIQCDRNNREGLFCGRCKKGYAPSLHAVESKCIECVSCFQNPVKMLYFIVAEILPLTIFYLIIVGARINIVSGPMLGYVLFCQGYINAVFAYPNVWRFIFSKSSRFVRFWNTNILLALSGVWNLNFFGMFLPNSFYSCRSSYLTVFLLDYSSVAYIFLLLILSYFAGRLNLREKFASCSCCKTLEQCLIKWRQNWSMSDSTIHALATFSALLCAKVGAITTQLLNATRVFNINGTEIRRVVTFEPYIDYLSVQHIPYVIAAYIPVAIFVLSPALILCLYPSRYFQSILRHCCGPRNRVALGIFFDTICSGYNDGLNGGRDYRRLYPLSLIVILVALFILSNMLSSLPETYFILLLPVFVFISFSTMYFRPCKTQAMNASLSFHLIIIGLSALTVALWIQDSFLNVQSLEIALTLFLTLPHVVMLLWFLSIILQRFCNCHERVNQLFGRGQFLLQRFE